MQCILLSYREFKLSDDMFAQDSIELLKQSGIDFAKMEARGIDVSNFGELLMSSGIVLNEDVSYHQNWSLLLFALLLHFVAPVHLIVVLCNRSSGSLSTVGTILDIF